MIVDEIKQGYTRVSDVISRYSGYGKVPQHILDIACARGTLVHDIIESFIDGFGCPNPPPAVEGYIKSFEKWFEHQHENTIFMPDRWYSDGDLLEGAMLTGKCDAVVVTPSENILVDFKTSVAVKQSWALQGGAYTLLAKRKGIPIDRVQFINLFSNGKEAEVVEIGKHAKFRRLDVLDCERLFMQALELHQLFK